METMRFDIKKSDGITNFSLWQDVLLEKTTSALWKKLEALAFLRNCLWYRDTDPL
ncbi:hypothetical protein Goarm_019987, partial [Gossypium armourianum]|nr:hypothetical protein [Gossypium armourianum]